MNKSILLKSKILEEHISYCVCIPTFKRYKYLKCAIESVAQQKNYDVTKLLILISDNDANDSSDRRSIIDYLDKLGISYMYYYSENNLGLFGNWNRVFELSPIEEIVLLHDDDILCADYFYEIDQLRKNKKGLNCIMPQQYTMKNDEIEIQNDGDLKKKINTFLNGRIYEYPLYMNYFTGINGYTTTGSFFVKSTVLNVGGFPLEDYPYADWTFFIKYVSRYKAYIYRKKLVIYRFEVNMGTNQEVMKEGERIYIKIIEWFEKEKLYAKVFKRFIKDAQINWYKAYLKKNLAGEHLISSNEVFNKPNRFHEIVYNCIKICVKTHYKIKILCAKKGDC